MRTVAITITKILNPVVTSLVTIAIVIFAQQMPTSQKLVWFTLGVLVAAVPTLILYFGSKNGEISSFWAPEGKERTKAFWAWVGIATIYALAAYLAGAPKLITALAVVLLALGAVNLIATSSFKLSVHSELITLLVLVCILAVSMSLIYLTALILLVAWARVYLKEHSLSEVAFGVFASIVAVYLIFSLFGLVIF